MEKKETVEEYLDSISTKIPDAFCFACGNRFTHATSSQGVFSPKEGDISLCIRCGAVGVYAKDLSILPASKETMRELQSDPAIAREISRVEFHRSKVFGGNVQ